MIKYDISVVMGAKNRKNLIRATIESIRNNGFNGSIEIIVVDGGSTDGTCDWLAQQRDVFTIVQPNYSVVGEDGVRKRKHTWGEFMNIGFKYANSDYICMVSDDLVLQEGCLQKAYDEMTVRIAKGEKIGGGAFFFNEYPRTDYYRVITLPKGVININHGFYYKPALEAVGWLDEISYNFYCGDGDIAMRLEESGWKVILFETCFAAHLVHLPKLKRSQVPQWQLNDIDTFKKKYPYETTTPDDMIKSSLKPEIDTKPFWKHAFKNVMLGYVLRVIDKKRKPRKY